MATRTAYVPRPPPLRACAPAAPHVLADLLRERAALEPIRPSVPHLWAMLEDEIARVGAAAADIKTAATLSSLAAGLSRTSHAAARSDAAPLVSPGPPTPGPPATPRKRVKLPVPAEKYPEYNFVGRLLGPRGTTLKALERNTGCKIMIRGKGSIRKDKEPEVRGKPGWEHVFNEALHVVVEVGDALDEAAASDALARAKDAVEVLLVPVPEERDGLKRQQLRALAIMNGTYRGGIPSRSSDSGAAVSHSAFSNSVPGAHGHHQYFADNGSGCVYLGESVAASASHHGLPSFERYHQHDERAPFRHSSFPRYDNGVDRKQVRPCERRTPSPGATRPTPGMYNSSNGANSKDIAALTSKMQHCAVDEFGSSSVGDDSPESSHSSEDGEPSTPTVDNAYVGHQVKVSAMSPGSCAEMAVGVGGFLGQEFYNGAFSNGPSPNPWDQVAPALPFSPGLYGSSPVPSPQVLTTSSTTVTRIDRRSGY